MTMTAVDGPIRFVIAQTKKMVRKPSRLFIIFRSLCNCVLSKLHTKAFAWRLIERSWHLPAPLDEIACAFFSPEQLKKWTGHVDAVLATQYFVRATRLVNRNHIARAAHAFTPCLQVSEEPEHFFWAAQIFYHGLGQMHQALNLWSRADQLERERANLCNSNNPKYQVFDGFWTGAVGHIAQLDYLIKQNLLERRTPDNTILYAPPHIKPANTFLMEQWSPYLRLVRRPEDLPFPEQWVRALRYPLYAPRRDDGTPVYFWNVAASVYRRWHEEGRGPLLALAKSVEERGRAALERAGIPFDAWFVGLHVRGGGYYGHHKGMHSVRNADIDAYVPAIEEIVHRGGWVVRMGDPTMKPMLTTPNLFDYCHSDIRTEWMDVFLAAKCRFLIGTSSGITYVSHTYGVPSVLTNWWPPVQRPWMPNDIFIPKLYRRLADDGHLTLTESLQEPFGYSEHLGYLEKHHGVTVEDNDPEDIRAAVAEMCDRLDGKATYSDEDIALRTNAHLIYESCGAMGSAALARDFLRKHRALLDIPVKALT
jgi:putative glycosyltransferase (TIGR04372 family)